MKITLRTTAFTAALILASACSEPAQPVLPDTRPALDGTPAPTDTTGSSARGGYMGTGA